VIVQIFGLFFGEAGPARYEHRFLARAAIAIALIFSYVEPGRAGSDLDPLYTSSIKVPEKKEEQSKDFTFEFNLPLRWSSSVVSGSKDSVLDAHSDVHATPELYLKWSHQYDWFKATADIGASLDRYARSPDANLDAVYNSFKIAKTDGEHELFVPYALFSNSIYFDPTFKNTGIAYHDFAAGFYSGIAWRDKELIPYKDSMIHFSDAEKADDFSILFDARVGRRLSDQTDYQNTFVQAKIELTYYITESLRFSLTPNIRVRWYDDYFGEARRDWRSGARVSFNWSPDWLKKLSKRSELGFDIDYVRNHSNLPEKSYSLWEVGPTLSLRTKF